MVLTQVPTRALPEAHQQRELVLADRAGHPFTRDHHPRLLDLQPGRDGRQDGARHARGRGNTRNAEADYRALAAEVFAAVDLILPTPEEADRGQEARRPPAADGRTALAQAARSDVSAAPCRRADTSAYCGSQLSIEGRPSSVLIQGPAHMSGGLHAPDRPFSGCRSPSKSPMNADHNTRAPLS